jgi:hypothetical protein
MATMNAKEIVVAALTLDPKVRAEVASQLIVSLDEEREQLTEGECEKLWLTESYRRARQMREGKVQEIPLEDAMRNARALLD